MIPQHLSNSVEHRTPGFIIDRVHLVLGGIDCDPASCTEANEIVKALTYFSLPNDGMEFDWHGRVFLNPPGGYAAKRWEKEYESRSNSVIWWRKLVDEYLTGRTREAIFLGFNLEILQTSQGGRWLDVLQFPFCVPNRRIAFTGRAPTHGNIIVYLPGDKPGDSRKFAKYFEDMGSVSL